MTTLDLSKIKPIPGFDSLKWKAKVQAQILKEIEGMSRRERLAYFHKAAERAAERRKAREEKLAAEESVQ
jgi:hypothetical protein